MGVFVSWHSYYENVWTSKKCFGIVQTRALWKFIYNWEFIKMCCLSGHANKIKDFRFFSSYLYNIPSWIFRLCRRRLIGRVATYSHWSQGKLIPSCLFAMCSRKLTKKKTHFILQYKYNINYWTVNMKIMLSILLIIRYFVFWDDLRVNLEIATFIQRPSSIPGLLQEIWYWFLTVFRIRIILIRIRIRIRGSASGMMDPDTGPDPGPVLDPDPDPT